MKKTDGDFDAECRIYDNPAQGPTLRFSKFGSEPESFCVEIYKQDKIRGSDIAYCCNRLHLWMLSLFPDHTPSISHYLLGDDGRPRWRDINSAGAAQLSDDRLLDAVSGGVFGSGYGNVVELMKRFAARNNAES